MDKIIALVSLIVVLGLVNGSIFKKEDHLANGEIVYLDLAPVDPRSLMQGDYMALRFEISTDIYNALPKTDEDSRWQHAADAEDGYVIVKRDDRNIAIYKALYTGQPLSDDEILLHYRVRNGEVKFATNAFFFQEGNADYYQPARYGQFRVDNTGELLLVGMYDKELKKIEPVTDELNQSN